MKLSLFTSQKTEKLIYVFKNMWKKRENFLRAHDMSLRSLMDLFYILRQMSLAITRIDFNWYKYHENDNLINVVLLVNNRIIFTVLFLVVYFEPG